MDMMKLNYQASVYSIPVAALVFVVSIFTAILTASTINTVQNIPTAPVNSTLGSLGNLLGAFAGIGFLALIIELLAMIAGLVSWGIVSIFLYKETQATAGSNIDRYPWLILVYSVILIIAGIILALILGTIIIGMLIHSVPTPTGY